MLGRAKEIFKWYNNHVSPAHIDEVICQHPAVSEVCTVGVMSEDGVNEFPRAFVTLKAGCERFTTVADITEFAHGNNRRGFYFMALLIASAHNLSHKISVLSNINENQWCFWGHRKTAGLYAFERRIVHCTRAPPGTNGESDPESCWPAEG